MSHAGFQATGFSPELVMAVQNGIVVTEWAFFHYSIHHGVDFVPFIKVRTVIWSICWHNNVQAFGGYLFPHCTKGGICRNVNSQIVEWPKGDHRTHNFRQGGTSLYRTRAEKLCFWHSCRQFQSSIKFVFRTPFVLRNWWAAIPTQEIRATLTVLFTIDRWVSRNEEVLSI
jgi:hypothetical protein